MAVRTVLRALIAAALSTSPALSRDLTVAARDAGWLAAIKAVYVDPFAAATAIPTQSEPWEGSADALRAVLKAGPPPWDVLLIRGESLPALCDEGAIERLDWSQVGGKEHYAPIAVGDCSIGGLVHTIVLAWDRDKFGGVPTWGDFFDIAKLPGKRGLRRSARTNLEIALLADGVAIGDIYKTLRSAEGLDRAFRKLDQLRPFIVWWQGPDEASLLLGSGEVLMTSASNGRISAANRDEKRNFGLQWSGGLWAVEHWAIPKGSPHLRQAYQFLYVAGSAAIQAQMMRHAPYPGLARGVNELLPPELQAISPTHQANIGAGLAIDEAFWRENGEKLGQRFAAWLAR